MILEARDRLLAVALRATHHHPTYPGQETPLPATPYLYMPIRKAELDYCPVESKDSYMGQKIEYYLSDGWIYMNETKNLLRKYVPTGHAAVDWELPYGFPVCAPCPGLAMASYYSYPLRDRQGNIAIEDGIRQRFGIGYFVQIYNLEQKRIIQLGHLSNIADNIPFSIPKREGPAWRPTGHIFTHEEATGGMANVTWVNTGDLIGFVGTSGMNDEDDYEVGYDRPKIVPEKEALTKAKPHIHMDESRRDMTTGEKADRRDVYNEYRRKDAYPTHYNTIPMREETLFVTDHSDRPKFADQ
jgi:hypothetical protein